MNRPVKRLRWRECDRKGWGRKSVGRGEKEEKTDGEIRAGRRKWGKKKKKHARQISVLSSKLHEHQSSVSPCVKTAFVREHCVRTWSYSGRQNKGSFKICKKQLLSDLLDSSACHTNMGSWSFLCRKTVAKCFNDSQQESVCTGSYLPHNWGQQALLVCLKVLYEMFRAANY